MPQPLELSHGLVKPHHQEVFYFVNHKTWSRDGHKCMTGKVSADPGRPCVFPFYATAENKSSLEWNCVVPTTYNKAIMT